MGGLGAVLSVTPPQLGSNAISTLAGASAATSLPGNSAAAPTTSATTNSSVTTAAPVTSPKPKAATTSKTTKKKTTASTSATSGATASASSNSSSNNNSTTSNSTTPTVAATPTKASSVSGSFTGDVINVGYGPVQVKITVSNGRITDAVALQAPSGRSQRFTDYAVPNLRQQTLSAQNANIQGVSGASYTSYGWYKSLISALQKAGMSTGV